MNTKYFSNVEVLKWLRKKNQRETAVSNSMSKIITQSIKKIYGTIGKILGIPLTTSCELYKQNLKFYILFNKVHVKQCQSPLFLFASPQSELTECPC